MTVVFLHLYFIIPPSPFCINSVAEHIDIMLLDKGKQLSSTGRNILTTLYSKVEVQPGTDTQHRLMMSVGFQPAVTGCQLIFRLASSVKPMS